MTVVTWRPSYRPERLPAQAELLDEHTGGAFILNEDGTKRWIPSHWIIEREEI